MKEFTITNVLRCWLKMWPMTVILIILGLVAGFLAANKVRPEYSAEMDLLIIDERDGSSAVEYAGLANSELVSNPAFEKAAVDDDCGLVASGTGNIIAFVANCPTNEDEVKHLASVAAENFTGWAQDIYGAENFKTVALSKEPTLVVAKSATRSKIIKLLVPGVAMLVLSVVIAFIYLDYKVSKGHGKKS
ncbi:hypothetical protein IJG73_01410 [Candidatus Saccharibacteria bacterium]|nr:hypothetical protein [Candidatus Saccharibacteria bacterium]